MDCMMTGHELGGLQKTVCVRKVHAVQCIDVGLQYEEYIGWVKYATHA